MADFKPNPEKPVKPDEGEESAHYDDKVIGRAFMGSAVLLAVIGLMAGGVYYYASHHKIPTAIRKTELTAPTASTRPVAEAPAAAFTDITESAGIHFVHNNGAYGEKLLPETMGSGVAFLDYNGDGKQDIFFVNSTYWPGHLPQGKKPTSCALYRNDGNGKFTDVTVEAGLDAALYGMGVAVGDYDNDGFPDIFVSGVNGNKLFHNEGNGKFRDVTELSGMGSGAGQWSTSATFIDYDNDGKLDLFVCNYVKWSREIDFEVGYKLVGVGRAYGQPMNFEGAFPKLYHNEGNGKFKDVSASAGIEAKNAVTGVPSGKSLGVAAIDLDGDGWIDLVVANDTVQNFVFHNERNGTFKEIGAGSGIGFDSYGSARGAMGIDAGWFRNDDAIGIGIGNFANEMTALYVSQRQPLFFSDESIAEGIGPASRLLLKFGLFFFDYDLDGRLDVLTANGHLEEDIGKIQKTQTYRQPAQLFWNAGAIQGGCFVAVPAGRAGGDLFKPIVGRGSAFADIDGDGDLDVVLTQTGGPPMLLRNDQNLGHHWVRVQLRGHASNRDGIGAQVRIKSGGETMTRQVMAARSYLSQSELPVTFGLGSHPKIDSAEVIWPGKKVQPLTNLQVDKVNVIEEAQ